jgi:hypothetical protein
LNHFLIYLIPFQDAAVIVSPIVPLYSFPNMFFIFIPFSPRNLMSRMVFILWNFCKKRAIKEPKKKYQGRNKKQGFLGGR